MKDQKTSSKSAGTFGGGTFGGRENRLALLLGALLAVALLAAGKIGWHFCCRLALLLPNPVPGARYLGLRLDS